MVELKKGRPFSVEPLRVAGWRQTRKPPASIRETAKHFNISQKTVSNYCRDYGEAARKARELWNLERKIEAYNRDIEEGERYMEYLERTAKASAEALAGREGA